MVPAQRRGVDRLTPGLRFPGPFRDVDVSPDGRTVRLFSGGTRDVIGDHPQIFRAGPLVLIQSLTGVFRLTDALGAKRVETFPEQKSTSSTSITWLDKAGLFVVTGTMDPAVYVSPDLVDFDRVDAPARMGAVAALPDRPGMLLSSAGGLYTLEVDCPPGG